MSSSLYKEIAYMMHRATVYINPRIEMARCYHKVFGEWPNFREPKSLMEKIYWLQLNTDTSLWSLCADKYRVREFLKERGCGAYLNIIYEMWDDPNEITWDSLPNQFVLKTNNGCGQNIIIDGRENYDIREVKKQFMWWINHPFGVSGAELHYLNIKPCIFAEKLLPIPNDELSLVEYKIWCFSGEPFCILVTYARTNKTLKLALFDLDWNPMMHHLKSTNHEICDSKVLIPRPESLNEMLSIAQKLSRGFPEVRIDFYEIDKKPLFGEMTFSTGFGYFTDEFYRILGDKVVLPRKCK